MMVTIGGIGVGTGDQRPGTGEKLGVARFARSARALTTIQPALLSLSLLPGPWPLVPGPGTSPAGAPR
jgi:hypothetical protein